MNISYTNNDRTLHLRWRDKNKNRATKDISDFRPYFYIRAIEDEKDGYEVKETVNGRRVKLWYPFEYETGDWVNLQGASLKKVYIHKPEDMNNARDCFRETYEADVKFVDRYAVDELKEINDVPLRKFYWDMEWVNNDKEHGDAITVIVGYDNYDETYYQWSWFPDEHYIEQKQRYSFHHHIFDNEKDMIQDFIEFIQEKDHDMLIAWFGNFADIPKLIHRCIHNGIDPRQLSI